MCSVFDTRRCVARRNTGTALFLCLNSFCATHRFPRDPGQAAETVVAFFVALLVTLGVCCGRLSGLSRCRLCFVFRLVFFVGGWSFFLFRRVVCSSAMSDCTTCSTSCFFLLESLALSSDECVRADGEADAVLPHTVLHRHRRQADTISQQETGTRKSGATLPPSAPTGTPGAIHPHTLDRARSRRWPPNFVLGAAGHYGWHPHTPHPRDFRVLRVVVTARS